MGGLCLPDEADGGEIGGYERLPEEIGLVTWAFGRWDGIECLAIRIPEL